MSSRKTHTSVASKRKFSFASLFRKWIREGYERARLKPVFEGLESRALLATFIVDTSADSGVGSLRQAILDANASAGSDSINFNPLPDAIRLTSGELSITDHLAIDASVGGSVMISGEGLSRLFTVSAGVNFTIDSLTLSGGSSFGSGAAMINDGITSILRSTISNNVAGEDAGAISNTGTLTIEKSTFVNNTSDRGGGAIRNSGTLTISHSTLAFNQAGIAGGAIRNDGTATITNTIVSGNSGGQAGHDIFGTISSGGYNLIERTDNLTILGEVEGNILGQSALLGLFGNYGGPTNTLPISANSPAYNAGPPGDIGTDQRGQARVGGNDIGAFESELNRFFITNDFDGGLGSIRQAILDANSYVGADLVLVSIPGLGAQSIVLSSALPVITEQVTIDGTTQPGFAGVPLIELSGESAGLAANGFEFGPGSDSSTLRGFVINRFEANAVQVEASGVTIVGNYLGTDATGLVGRGNFGNGINLVPGVANGTIIGGPSATDRNVISGNGSNGIFSWDVIGTTIQGNYIGIDALGITSIPNHFQGIALLGGSDANVGGSAPGEGNVISGGTTTPGVLVEGATGTLIRGNRIGTSADGLAAVGNNIGIYVLENFLSGIGAVGTIIGGTTDEERNLISGNHTGIYVAGDANSNTQVLGNWIGVDVSGQTSLPNATGIQVDAGTTMLIGGPTTLAGTQAGNLISGNAQYGILLNGGSGTVVAGNMIGLANDGNAALGNGTGIFGNTAADDVLIGGIVDGARNVVSGNSNGLVFHVVSGGLIQGNYIGLNRTGDQAAGNTVGIELSVGAQDFFVGGVSIEARNIVSGNSSFGIAISGETTTANTIAGNWIGIAADGVTPIANLDEGIQIDGGAHHNTIGGTTSAAGNVISGNAFDGIGLFTGANHNSIQNNLIGTDSSGSSAIANGGSGIVINSANNNELTGNTVSGNVYDGIVLFGAGAFENLIVDNKIGTDATGTAQLYHDGTVGWWKGEDNANNVIDSSVGTLQGDVRFGDSVVRGRAFQFNADGFVSSPDAPALNPTSAITLEAWVNPVSFDPFGGVDQLVIGKNNGYQLSIRSNGTVRFFLPGIDGGGGAHLDSALTLSLNAWTHVAGTYDGVSGAWRIYFDGNLAGSGTLVGIIDSVSGPVLIGGLDFGLGLFNGRIDDPTIYNRALSQLDVQRIFSAQATGKGAGNAFAGVAIHNGASDNILALNVISGNGGLDNNGGGISIIAANDNLIGGNFIGTDLTGTVALGNYKRGIYLENAVGNRIGGSGPGELNLISGNGLERLSGLAGVYLGNGANENRVEGNYLGTDGSGNAPLLNSVLTSGDDGSGVYIAGNDNFIENNVIGDFALSGVWVDGDRNTVAGNSIGVGANGIAAIPNNNQSDGGGGIFVSGASNLIGGTLATSANVVSGNNRNGILIYGERALENIVQGNFVGLLRDGETERGNLGGSFDGAIAIGSGAANTQVLQNIISGNSSIAVRIQDAHTNGTVLRGNVIGTNASGTTPRPNFGGIFVGGGPAGTVIGGVDPNDGNLISGNDGDGIAVTYSQEDEAQTWLRADGNTQESSIYRFGQQPTVSTVGSVGYEPGRYGAAFKFVSGNGYLESAGGVLQSTNAGATFWFKSNGTAADSVVLKMNAASPTVVADFAYQIRIQADGRMVLESSDGESVLRTNPTANSLLDGQWHFIAASTLKSAFTDGGLRLSVDGVQTGANIPIADISAANKLVLGPSFSGAVDDLKIHFNMPSAGELEAMRFAGSDPVVIQNNRIGTNANGDQPIANTANGISISDEMLTNVVSNTIGGNSGYGIRITHYATGINVQGNFIGTNDSDSTLLGNANGILVENMAHDVVIGGTSAATRNIISGNAAYGIELTSSVNVVIGNYIGTNVDGDASIPNAQGIRIIGSSNRIGTDGDNLNDQAERNVISGNSQYGILVLLGNDNRIAGNYIGTNADGDGPVANGDVGVAVAFASGNIIGTDGSDDRFNTNERNVISGNTGRAVVLVGDNSLAGNYIGVDATGSGPLSNGEGVQVTSTGSRVGTNADGIADEEERNIISGNVRTGIIVRDVGTTRSIIAGNYIGLAANGTDRIGNGGDGITIAGGPDFIRVGTNGDGRFDEAERNVISGNNGNGISISSATGNTADNMIAGNFIGTDAAGATGVGNLRDGVRLEFSTKRNTIGGPTEASRNIISGNVNGVHLVGVGTSDNLVVGNLIGTDSSGLKSIANAVGVLVAGGASDNRIEGGYNDLSSSAFKVAGAFPWQLATGDFNGDGKTDMVVATAGFLNVLLSDGNGGFTAGQAITTFSTASNYSDINIAVGDFNGDQKLDLLASGAPFDAVNFEYTDGKLLVYLGIGDGTFSASALINEVNGIPRFVTPGDFNRDGRLDVAVSIDSATSSGVSIFLGNGSGLFSHVSSIEGIHSPFSLTLADLNQDGKLDIVADTQSDSAGRGISTLLGNGDGTFTVNSMQLLYAINVYAGNTFGSGVADFNGDGIPDIVAGGKNVFGAANSEIAYFQGTGDFSGPIEQAFMAPEFFSVPTSQVGTVAVGDFDSDGHFDVAVNAFNGSTQAAIGILYGTGQGSFERSFAYASRVGNHLIATDFDADGRTDLAMTNYQNETVTVLRQVVALPNVASGNTQAGVSITGNGTSQNTFAGNYIGLGSDGKTLINNQIGVQITNGASSNIIGGASSTHGNVIGGNSAVGVLITNSSDNNIGHNAIGLSAFGNPAPNFVGIHVSGTDSSNSIHDNEVRFSTTDNILIESIGNTLRRNLTAEMGALPIHLDPAGLSPGNVSVKQVVNGANPVILGEVQLSSETIQANSALVNPVYIVELFSSPNEGQASRFVASQQVSINALGFGSFSITPGMGELNGFVSATLTGPGVNGVDSTSPLSNSLIGTPVIILGLRSQSPEGTPITLSAFASTNLVTGYLWEVEKDGEPYGYDLRNSGTESEGGIQFTPDNQGVYTVTLRVTLADGSLYQAGPFETHVYNLAPTVSLDYAPENPTVGQPVTLLSSTSDPGQQDEIESSWVVRYGSSTGPIAYIAPPSTNTTTSFIPSSGGFYYVTLTGDDGDGGVQSQTREIEVRGMPALASILLSDNEVSEGQVVRASVPESELSRSEQLSFTWKVTKGNSTVEYPITIPSHGIIEFVPHDEGSYKITLMISDGTRSIDAQPVYVEVSNSDPRIEITTATTIAMMGVPIHLQSIVSDLGSSDTHSVHWSVTRFRQPFGTTSVGASFSFTPTAAGTYVVTAVAIDNDGGQRKTSRAFTLVQTPVEVTILEPDVAFLEGVSYTFTAQVPNPGSVASYIWMARTINGIDVVSGSEPDFSFTPTRGGDYQIELQVTLNDGRVGNAIFNPMTVEGLAPSIDDLYILDELDAYEGSQIIVRSEASDPNESQLSYKWELKKPGSSIFQEMEAVDGSPYDFRFVPTDNSLFVQPLLAGNADVGTFNPDYEVRLTVTDSQGLTVQRSLSVNVQNAVPQIRLTTLNRPPIAVDPHGTPTGAANITFQAIGSDPGIDDLPDLRYTWSVNGSVVESESSSSQFTTSIEDLQFLQVVISDGDGGFTHRDFFVLKGTETSDVVTLNQNSTPVLGGGDQILYLALGGNDSISIDSAIVNKVVVLGGDGNDRIDASQALVEVLLDGGDGDDHLTGGKFDDLLIAGGGRNTLVGGNGNNRFVGGGNDTMNGGINSDYYEVHFSEVVITDAGGGNDTIDLSAAQSGVKLNLSDNAGVPQEVFVGSTLAINGNFENLIGSPHDDELTTQSVGTTIDAGLGNDQILIEDVFDVQVRGGSGNDKIVITNASGTIEGGDGSDTITGTLTSGSVTQISTGAGDDIVRIQGSQEALSEISVSMGSGNNSLNASYVTGKIFASNGGDGQSIDVFGTAESSVAAISVSDSSNIDIFGTSSLGGHITVTNSGNIDIFGNGVLELDNVDGGTITTTLFGTASTRPALATVNNSNNIEIFGTSQIDGPGLNATVSGSSNISIFGTANPSDSRVTVSDSSNIEIFGVRNGTINLDDVRGGHNVVEISNFGTADSSVQVNIADSSDIEIFGSATASGPAMVATVAGSSNIDIFGTSAPVGSIIVAGSTNIDIFGTAAPVGSITVSGSSNIDIFGTSATGNTNIDVAGSHDVDIFGSSLASSSLIQATVTGSSNISIFGSAAQGTTGVAVADSQDIEIFGSASPNGSNLVATVQNSSNIDIFGTAKGNDSLIVSGGNDIEIYGILSGDVAAAGVNGLAIHASTFGSAVSGSMIVRVSDSNDIDIFGSSHPSGSVLQATVHDSQDVDIFGSASPGTITVQAGSDIDIFGTAHAGTKINVSDAGNIDIYSGYGDQITLNHVTRANVNAGVFGTASGPGVNLVVLGGSSNIDIFGSPENDHVQVINVSRVSLSLGIGDDTIMIDSVTGLLVFGDAGSDRITVRSGKDMLFYLGEGIDRAEIIGGEQVRVIGDSGADEMMLAGGSGVTLDGGDGDDQIVVIGGTDLRVRGDAGADRVDIYGGIGVSVAGGQGDDQLRIIGTLGGALAAGKVYALMDGQGGTIRWKPDRLLRARYSARHRPQLRNFLIG
jgi:parallel beta-helix repeat protein